MLVSFSYGWCGSGMFARFFNVLRMVGEQLTGRICTPQTVLALEIPYIKESSPKSNPILTICHEKMSTFHLQHLDIQFFRSFLWTCNILSIIFVVSGGDGALRAFFLREGKVQMLMEKLREVSKNNSNARHIAREIVGCIIYVS